MVLTPQSRSSLATFKRAEGTDIVARFRELAPSRDPISIQRWSVRRVALAFGAVAVVLFFLQLLVQNILGAGFI